MLQEQAKQIHCANGVKISYYYTPCPGASHTLVMLHGMASNHTRWTEFIGQTKLKNQVNLLSLDLRGHANSMVHGRSMGHKIWIQDLYEILKQESLDNIILLGHSMGAQLALHYVACYPNHVTGLILIDPTIPSQIKGRLAIARQFRYLLWLFILILRLAYKISPVTKTYPLCDLHALDIKTREILADQPANLIAKLYTSPKEDLKYLPLLNYLQDLYAAVSPLPSLSNIQCPVYLLLSKSSSIVRPEKIKKYFSSIAMLKITNIDANHWPLTEKPEETRHAIDDWCQHLLTTNMNKTKPV